MESKIPSDLKIQTFKPTLEEFKDFSDIIRRIGKNNFAAKVGNSNLLFFAFSAP